MQPFSTIAVCGAGAMGAGIAQVAAKAGHAVVVYDVAEGPLERGRAMVEAGLKSLVKRGTLDEGGAAEVAGRVRWTTELAELAPAGLVIEAIIEDAAIKGDLFAKLEAVLAADAAIATNTSSLSVTALAARLERPERFLGMHFFNPAPVMKLVEVVAGAATDPALAAAITELATAWGKVAVPVRDVPGFIVNRVARPFYGEGWRALDEGVAEAAGIDHALRACAGFRMGPLELGDLIGQDINFAVARSVYEAYFGRGRFTPQLAQGAMVAAGRLGRKTGRGVYDYGEGAVKAEPHFLETVLDIEPVPEGAPAEGIVEVEGVLIGRSDGRMAASVAAALDKPVALHDWARPDSDTMVFALSTPDAASAAAAFARRAGKKAMVIADRPGMLVLRTLAQLANSAADALRDRVADAEGIDRAMMNGANYPFGPLAWARQFGPAALVQALTNIAEETGEEMYRPSEALRRMALEVGQ
jgi:3-hydroxybutyryl-CoA dehydrogenase